MSRRRPGFVLIELSVTMAIIALMITAMKPAVQRAEAANVEAQYRDNVKQVQLVSVTSVNQEKIAKPLEFQLFQPQLPWKKPVQEFNLNRAEL